MTAILGIASHYHDAAAALFVDGRLIAAAQEERFSRIKHDASFPKQAIEYCLTEAEIKPEQIDYVAYYEKPLLKFERVLETYLQSVPWGYPFFRQSIPSWTQSKLHIRKAIYSALQGEYRRQIVFVPHHHSHAATAFFNSPFDKAAILTIDGVGEWTTTSIGRGTANRIEMKEELCFPHSVGLLYSAFTAYLGFRVNDGEYKLMGLASYGKPVFKDRILSKLIDWRADGSFRLNMRYFDFCRRASMISKDFEDCFEGPSRRPTDPITERHKDIASSIQSAIEEMILRIAQKTYESTHEKHLVMAGGVALNCVANSRVASESPFDSVWIHGAAGDAGGAIGAAQFIWYQLLGNPRDANFAMTKSDLFLGPSFDNSDVEALLAEAGFSFTSFEKRADLCDAVAGLLGEQKIVGWFQGRMEMGPRALGSRSILADARVPEMKDLLNRTIKRRESFRPFAPAVLAEHASTYFVMQPSINYSTMTFIAHVTKQFDASRNSDGSYEVFPSVIHSDGSVRMQTVSETDNPSFYQLLAAFYRRTDCPLVINTSFNVFDEPIVCTPQDAIRCFQSAELDALAIENCLAVRQMKDRKPKSNDGDLSTAQEPRSEFFEKELRYAQNNNFLSGIVASGPGVWHEITILPAKVIAEASMIVTYFGVFVAMGLFRQFFNLGRLDLKMDATKDSYWISCDEDLDESFYFRQS